LKPKEFACKYFWFVNHVLTNLINDVFNDRAVKIGTTQLSAEENVANIMGSVESIIKRIPKKWANILSIHLKTSESIALPLYTALPDAAESEKTNVEKEKTVAKKEAEKPVTKKAEKVETKVKDEKKAIASKTAESAKDKVARKKAASSKTAPALKTKKKAKASA
jgi:ribosome biogenesis protein UTP30